MSRMEPWVNYVAPLKPRYQTAGSAGCDLVAVEQVTIPAGEWRLVGTGLFLEIPDGFAGLVCPRSGLAVKNGVTVLNAPGILDSDYRGEVKVILMNHSTQEYSVKIGDRIAQLLFTPVAQVKFMQRDQLGETERGEGGFGSTGK